MINCCVSQITGSDCKILIEWDTTAWFASRNSLLATDTKSKSSQNGVTKSRYFGSSGILSAALLFIVKDHSQIQAHVSLILSNSSAHIEFM